MDYNNFENNAESTAQINSRNELAEVITVKDWLLTLLLLALPLVNIIMLCIWSFSDNVNPNKKSFARAELIWIAIATVLSTIFTIIIVAIVTAAFTVNL